MYSITYEEEFRKQKKGEEKILEKYLILEFAEAAKFSCRLLRQQRRLLL
jgi:hypothetical protein